MTSFGPAIANRTSVYKSGPNCARIEQSMGGTELILGSSQLACDRNHRSRRAYRPCKYNLIRGGREDAEQ